MMLEIRTASLRRSGPQDSRREKTIVALESELALWDDSDLLRDRAMQKGSRRGLAYLTSDAFSEAALPYPLCALMYPVPVADGVYGLSFVWLTDSDTDQDMVLQDGAGAELAHFVVEAGERGGTYIAQQKVILLVEREWTPGLESLVSKESWAGGLRLTEGEAKGALYLTVADGVHPSSERVEVMRAPPSDPTRMSPQATALKDAQFDYGQIVTMGLPLDDDEAIGRVQALRDYLTACLGNMPPDHAIDRPECAAVVVSFIEPTGPRPRLNGTLVWTELGYLGDGVRIDVGDEAVIERHFSRPSRRVGWVIRCYSFSIAPSDRPSADDVDTRIEVGWQSWRALCDALRSGEGDLEWYLTYSSGDVAASVPVRLVGVANSRAGPSARVQNVDPALKGRTEADRQ